MIIAMDGPAGSGKTTAAKLLAKKLNILYLDTGATYRALTLKILRAKIGLTDESALEKLAQSADIRLKDDKTFLDAEDVSESIRVPEIDKAISPIVALKKIRAIMVKKQQAIAHGKDVVAEGRDVTTVVFPNAEFKFYLDADPQTRANRRFKEFQAKGIDCDFEKTKEQLINRDYADINRQVGALKRAPGAITLDTTNLTIDQVVEKIASYVKNHS